MLVVSRGSKKIPINSRACEVSFGAIISGFAEDVCTWRVGYAKDQHLRVCTNINDTVGFYMHRDGQWIDCKDLPSLWNTIDYAGKGTRREVFMDIGANIGACTFEMASLGTPVLAFEPLSSNLFYLTSSVAANPRLANSVRVFPFALGEATNFSPIFSQSQNQGNTVVGVAVPDSVDARMRLVDTVSVRKLDEVITSCGGGVSVIRLLKLDAQGYELKVLKGAVKTLRSGRIKAIKFELAPKWLLAQQTSAVEVCNELRRFGYSVLSQTGRPMDCAAVGQDEVQDAVALAPGVSYTPV